MRGEPIVAQTAMTGSLISSCLIIFGKYLLFGGILCQRQCYPVIIARTNAQLLVVSLISMAIPIAFWIFSDEGDAILFPISQEAAVVLLLEFASYLWFFYHTHTDLAVDDPSPNMKSGLLAAGILPTMIPVPAVAKALYESEECLSLRGMRVAAQKELPRLHFPIYIDIIILLCAVPAVLLAFLYVREAIEALRVSLSL